jgi:uncharacterized protein (DUF302 family)
MKNIYLVGLILLTTFFVACENSNTVQNSTNNLQDQNTSAKTRSSKDPAEKYIKIKSENGFDETYLLLKKAIESKEPLTIVAELDHSANAKKAGMELPPTKIIMFGNPKLGTPLMKANQEIGIDLPQKMLVYKDGNGDVFVVYNDPKDLAENHGIKDQDEITAKISEALKGLAEIATKKGVE